MFDAKGWTRSLKHHTHLNRDAPKLDSEHFTGLEPLEVRVLLSATLNTTPTDTEVYAEHGVVAPLVPPETPENPEAPEAPKDWEDSERPDDHDDHEHDHEEHEHDDEEEDDHEDHDGHHHGHEGHNHHHPDCNCDLCTEGVHAHGTPTPPDSKNADETDLAVGDGATSNEDPDYGAYINVADIPTYESRPDASNVIYLNFIGGEVRDTAWNSSDGIESWDVKPYDLDGDWHTFSASEQNKIFDTWQAVAEDFAPFDVNVTTKAPETITRTTAVAMITQTTDLNGERLPHYGWAGIAYVGVFGASSFGYYSPAWYTDTSNAANLASGISHEVGHNLGLGHDGRNGSTYYYGHDISSGNRSNWTPLMGAGNGHLSQWSNGGYHNSTNDQDDLAILADKLGYRSDDHGDDAASATAVDTTHGSYFHETGVIETTDDPDVFSFYAYAGEVSIDLTPEVYFTSGAWGTNLDSMLELRDSQGNLLASDNPADGVTPSIDYTITTEGTYYISVIPVGAGNPDSASPTGYTSYGSLGQYELTGTYVYQVGDYAPLITEEPQSQSLLETNQLSLSVQAHGSPILSYQWYKDGQLISGANSSSYIVNSAATSDAGNYTVVVSNSEGSQTSTSAIVTVEELSDFIVTVNFSGSSPALTIENPNNVDLTLSMASDQSLEILTDNRNNVIATLDSTAIGQTISAGGTLVIPITLNTTGLAERTYEGSRTFNTSNLTQSSFEVEFSYTHGESPPPPENPEDPETPETPEDPETPETPEDPDAPIAISPANITINENMPGGVPIYIVSAGGTGTTYSLIDNADDDLFSINSSTGYLSFNQSPDYENPLDDNGDNTYQVNVEAISGNTTYTQLIEINVSNVVEKLNLPVPKKIFVNENITSPAYTLGATGDGPITYTLLSGNDAALFSLDRNTGELSFRESPNYEDPDDRRGRNRYQVRVAADNGSRTVRKTLKIDVLNVIETISLDSTQTVFANENDAGTVYTPSVIGNGPITYSLAGGQDSRRVTINSSTGEVSFISPPDYENPNDANTDNRYTFTIRASNGDMSVTQNVNLQVEDIDEAVIFLSVDHASVEENTPASDVVHTVLATGDGLVSYTLAGGADDNQFTLDQDTGELRFKQSPDYENPLDLNADNTYEVLVQADDGGETNTQLIRIQVLNEKERLVVTTPKRVFTDENMNGTVFTTLATGDGSITYSLINRQDAGQFNIDRSSGEVSFKSAPDYENPDDTNRRNDYAIKVQAFNGSKAVKRSVKIFVQNLDEAPILASPFTIEVNDSIAPYAPIHQIQASDESSLRFFNDGGEDSEHFSVNSVTGEISFITSPDFESPNDLDGDNLYHLNIRVSDGLLSTTQSLAVQVLDERNESTIVDRAA